MTQPSVPDPPPACIDVDQGRSTALQRGIRAHRVPQACAVRARPPIGRDGRLRLRASPSAPSRYDRVAARQRHGGRHAASRPFADPEGV